MSFVAYNQELIDTTIEANRNTNVRTVVIWIAIVVIVIVIALLIYFIVRYMMNRQALANAQNGGATKCTTDGNCPASAPVCQSSSGLCVQCRDNSQCSGSITKCDPVSNSCVQCLADSDCPTCSECKSNICKVIDDPPAPTVTNAEYLGVDTLKVDWTAVPGAINYVVEFGLPKSISMLPKTVGPEVTTLTIPPGQGSCYPVGINNVTVSVITSCGRSTSAPFPLLGQACPLQIITKPFMLR